MAFTTAQGGNIDVNPRLIGANINAGPLFGTPQNFGNLTLEGRQPETLHVSVQPGWLIGDWLTLADDNLVADGASMFTRTISWRMPDLSEILLTQDEWIGDGPLWTFSNRFYLHNAKVRLTQNTLRGFVAYGIIAPEVANRLGGGLEDTEGHSTSPLGTLGEGVSDVAGNVVKAATVPFMALAVVAVIVGAIWFLPKDTLAKAFK